MRPQAIQIDQDRLLRIRRSGTRARGRQAATSARWILLPIHPTKFARRISVRADDLAPDRLGCGVITVEIHKLTDGVQRAVGPLQVYTHMLRHALDETARPQRWPWCRWTCQSVASRKRRLHRI